MSNTIFSCAQDQQKSKHQLPLTCTETTSICRPSHPTPNPPQTQTRPPSPKSFPQQKLKLVFLRTDLRRLRLVGTPTQLEERTDTNRKEENEDLKRKGNGLPGCRKPFSFSLSLLLWSVHLPVGERRQGSHSKGRGDREVKGWTEGEGGARTNEKRHVPARGGAG